MTEGLAAAAPSAEDGSLFPRPAREWCECGAGLFILMRGAGGERYFECGACESVVTG